MCETFHKAYRYRLYPTKAQVSALDETLDTCRLVYNSLLHERTVSYAVTGKSPSYLAQKRAIASWKHKVSNGKPNHAELSGVHSQVLQNVCKRVDLAFQAFFRRVAENANAEESRSGGGRTPHTPGFALAGRVQVRIGAGRKRKKPPEEREPVGYPRKKGEGQYDSLTYPQHENGFGIVHGRLRLSKIGDVAIRLHRPVEGDVKTCTVRRTPTGKWFACFTCEVEPELLPPSDAEIGIDVGIKVFAALSNGEFIKNPRFFCREEDALAKAQRKEERLEHTPGARKPSHHRVKHGKNKGRLRTMKPALTRARRAIAHIHERIASRRHDFVHQTTRRLVNRFGVIAVEALQVENMMATPAPKPDPENPGQFLPNGAAAKAGLNKSIADVSWSMFRNILTMKAESAGRKVVAVNPAYTSQMCSGCGNIVKKTLKKRQHDCQKCGLSLDRDTNASINIMALGQKSLATVLA